MIIRALPLYLILNKRFKDQRQSLQQHNLKKIDVRPEGFGLGLSDRKIIMLPKVKNSKFWSTIIESLL